MDDNRATPTPGETWRHYKGGVYKIILWFVWEATRQPALLYSDEKSGAMYGRDMQEFMGNNEAGEPRFVKV